MKTHTEYLYLTTKKQKEMVNITREVGEAVKKSGVKEGLVLVNAMHITFCKFGCGCAAPLGFARGKRNVLRNSFDGRKTQPKTDSSRATE